MHGRGSFPSKADGNPHSQPHSQLDDWFILAQSIAIAQIPPSQPLRMPGNQGQICQERTVPQPMVIVPGNSFRLSLIDGCGHTRACSGHTASRGLLHDRSLSPIKTFQKMLGLMASASPVLQLGLLRMWPLQRWLKPRVPSYTVPGITDACVSR